MFTFAGTNTALVARSAYSTLIRMTPPTNELISVLLRVLNFYNVSIDDTHNELLLYLTANNLIETLAFS